MDPDYVEKINKPSIIEGLKFMFIPSLIAPLMAAYMSMETMVSPIYILSQLFSRTFYAWPFTPMMPFQRELQKTINLFSFRWTLSGLTYLFTSKAIIQMIQSGRNMIAFDRRYSSRGVIEENISRSSYWTKKYWTGGRVYNK